MTSASSQRLTRSARRFCETVVSATTTPELVGQSGQRHVSRTIAPRTPQQPPSSAPAGLADGFGPKELSPTLFYQSDSPRGPFKVRYGSPAPRCHPGVRRFV